MLGVTRPRRSRIQAVFQRAGQIACVRDHLTILDRPALEEQSCDCYRVISDAIAAL